MTLREHAIGVAEAHGVTHQVFYDRSSRMGWSILDSCTVPKRKYT